MKSFTWLKMSFELFLVFVHGDNQGLCKLYSDAKGVYIDTPLFAYIEI